MSIDSHFTFKLRVPARRIKKFDNAEGWVKLTEEEYWFVSINSCTIFKGQQPKGNVTFLLNGKRIILKGVSSDRSLTYQMHRNNYR